VKVRSKERQPFIGAQVRNVAWMLDAGIVDQDIEAARRQRGFIERGRDDGTLDF
jgi:hypothetical protein